MTPKTHNGLVVGDYVLYESSDGVFKEAVINGVLNEDEVSLIFTVNGQLTNRILQPVLAEWCTKHEVKVNI